MPCPDESTVERFLAGDLDEAGRRRVKSHLADCAPCCELVGALVMSTAKEGESRAASRDASEGAARLSRYRLERPLGVGGMGVVYSAYDPELARRVALKVLWTDDAAGKNDAGRLHREARAMAKLAHPNVVQVFDVGVDGDRVFLAMELAEGGTLRAWMREGPHPWREVLARFRQAGAGLAAAHRAGLIHRDFKPENLLLRADGTVLVTDFGLAHEVPFGEALSTLSSKDAGDAPGVAGTPAYMAPEQLRGEPLDARADVYAFSVVVWEALHGARPFAPDADEGLLGAIAKGAQEPARPASLEPVPERLRRALARGMSFRRRERPASMDALLAECAIDEPARTARPWARRSVLLGIGAAVLVTGVAVGRGSVTSSLPSSASSSSSFGEAPISSTTVSAAMPSSSSVAEPATAPSATAPSAPARTASARAPSGALHPPTAAASATASLVPDARAGRRGTLRGMDFTPYGFAGSEAGEVVKAHASDFDGCWSEGCVDLTCRFVVGETGAVARATCAPWEGRPACPATQTCLAQKIRALHFPAPPEQGESSLYFGGR